VARCILFFFLCRKQRSFRCPPRVEAAAIRNVIGPAAQAARRVPEGLGKACSSIFSQPVAFLAPAPLGCSSQTTVRLIGVVVPNIAGYLHQVRPRSLLVPAHPFVLFVDPVVADDSTVFERMDAATPVAYLGPSGQEGGLPRKFPQQL